MDHITFAPVLETFTESPERCDRCGAAAKLIVTLAEGELAFCGHHANRQPETIIRVAVRIALREDFPWSGTAALGGVPSTVDSPPAPRAPRPYRNSR